MGGTPPLSDEVLKKAVDARGRHKSNAAAARELGVARETFTHWMKRAVERGMDGSVPSPMPVGRRVKAVSTYYNRDESGEWVEKGMWVKAAEDHALESVTTALKAAFDEYQGRAKPVPAPKHGDGELLSVYPIADQHHGLLAWGEESGEDYDIDIGAARLRACMSRLIAQSAPSKGAIVLNLGDYFHNDDSRNVTPASGHALDVDTRYVKILRTGVQLMMDCIDLALAKHETVLVRNLPGNHDPHASIALTVALSAFYAKDKRVVVDDDPGEWFFHRFGSTLLGANHGHRAKPADMAMNMAVRRAKDWGETKYRYLYFGHIHHETVREVGDVRVESFQTLASKDAYSAGHGFNSGQSLTAVTIHRTDGEIGRHKVNFRP